MDNFFAAHAIDPEVGAERPYVRFEKGDCADALAADPTMRPSWLAWVAHQSGGYAMLKTPVPVPGLDPVRTQLRSDHDIRTGPDTWTHYLLTKAPREVYVKAHADMRPENVAPHIQKHHGGADIGGAHAHESRHPAPDQHPEKRLDMHPRSAALLPAARRVFFALEGVIKADALLSAGECVFDVPSVTLWDVPELKAFAEMLCGRTVLICPDADWVLNPQVSLQAFECREALRRLGLVAHVVTWPLEKRHATKDCKRKDCVKGIDDLLAKGGHVDDLVTVDREMSPGFNRWKAERAGRRDAAATDLKTLRWMALHADGRGQVAKSAQAIARYTGQTEKTAHRSVVRLVESGALTADKVAEFADERYIRTRRPDGKLRRRPLSLGPGWREAPVFTIRRGLRAASRNVSIGSEAGRAP